MGSLAILWFAKKGAFMEIAQKEFAFVGMVMEEGIAALKIMLLV